eukprot:CAMPEP_0114578930 /NCGR_PEP_ID=MMETSP0125-20121206/3401_1 /TAXON_ID=485358 ORGANISM="Aristerostoma sp., Strain ATCC 50986" /NCGR_SAMPLE_ID=MMETSP0125 /ASSEMBLY_ACC=CAM_ASM_000245 /LENGTH=85 /DNA_ID=CAMNT_0001769355 /DNA_START=3087 /DNA_END=3347 /DNA_ORIENTATION=+
MFPGASDSQMELFMFKEQLFKELPLLVLSVEQFGTLEVIEDYLLNKLNSKEDLASGMLGRKDIHDYIREKFEANQDKDSDDESSS